MGTKDDRTTRLAAFIQTQEPGIKGFEKRNLERMRQFYESYPEITTAVRTQLIWTHHRIIMSRCKSEAERLFYLELTATERCSTRELERQINSGIFDRTRLADAKLPQTSCPKPLTGVFRDNYVLDFLNLSPNHSENDLKTALVNYLRDFILELGRDFTFLGQEYRQLHCHLTEGFSLRFSHTCRRSSSSLWQISPQTPETASVGSTLAVDHPVSACPKT